MKYSLLKLSVLVVPLAFAIGSCKKETTTQQPLDYDTQSSQDNALAENTWNDMGSMSDQAADGSNSLSSYRPDGTNSLLNSCATVSLVTGTPYVITVDFGTAWCLCHDGRYRKGKFTISFTGNYTDSGTVITVAAASTDNYYIKYLADTNKWIKVTGTRTVTNKGHNSSGHLWYDVNVNGTLYNNSSQTLTWTSHRTREWVAGASTPTNWLDDQYSITGDASGTSFEGVHFTVSIDSGNPLFVDFTCFTSQPYSCKITKGKFTLTPDNLPPRYVDFGSGACDNAAVVTVNNQPFTIYVR